MSATVDCGLFSNYFSILINGKQEGAPIIQVDGKMFDVDEYYFEDISGLSEVLSWTKYFPMSNISLSIFAEICQIINVMHRINTPKCLLE